MRLNSYFLAILLAFFLLLSFGCKGGDSGTIAIPIYIHNPGDQDPATKLTDIFITPGWINVAVGDSQVFKATARYGDGKEVDWTNQVVWVVDGLDWTSNRGYFPAYGNLVTTGVGTLNIQVRFNGQLHGKATVGVFNPDVDVPPKPPVDFEYGIMPDGDVNLTWLTQKPDPPDLLGFNIYRSRTSLSGYEQLNHEPILNRFYSDDKAAGGIYYYVVTAIDIGANESDYSYQLTVDNR